MKKAYIEITNICNLDCDFCSKTNRNPEFMSLSLFEEIILQIKPYTNYIYLHILGEPLLHENLAEFLDICTLNNIQVNITTNGTLINKATDKIISKNSLRLINFSLHSFYSNKLTISFDKYINDIFEYIKKDNHRHICLRLWNLNSENSEKNNYILERIQKEFNLEFKLEEKITLGNGIKLKDKLYLQQSEYFTWPNIKNKPFLNTGFCYALRNQFGILVDGTVIPCCLDSEGVINLGNIKQREFKDIINSDKALNLYNGFCNRNLVEDLCKTCGYIDKKF